MAPPSKRRRTRATAKELPEETICSVEVTQEAETIPPPKGDNEEVTGAAGEDPTPINEAILEQGNPGKVQDQGEDVVEEKAEDKAAKAQDRMARFKALKARAKTSSETNMKEASLESQRLATDPGQLKAMQRQHATASHKLLKADVEDAGGDFERKRAWDWTIDESEKWDKRMKKKASHRDNNAFQDYRQESNKVYKKQLRNIDPSNLERYDKEKRAMIEKAAASGGLDIVETEDGELIAIDKDGSFYSTADSTSFAQNKPDKAAVDRLVADLRKADEQRLKKRKERMAQNGDDGDVTFINEKNKQFNQKLARFYDKYTADIRDSFDRGTRV